MNESTRLTHEGFHSGGFWGERTALEKILLVLLALVIAVGIILSIAIATHKTGFAIFNTSIEDGICNTTECIISAAQLISSLNTSVDPCKNFFRFSCGGWLKKTFLLGGRVSRFTKLSINIMLRMKELLDTPMNDDDPVHWVKTRNFYRSCMNIDVRQDIKAHPLIKDLEEFGLWPPFQRNNSDDFNWITVLKKMFQRGYDYNILLRVFADLDLKNSSTALLSLDQPTLGMGNRIFYLSKSFEVSPTEIYKWFILKCARLLFPGLNVANATEKIEDAINIEILLAKASLSPSARKDFTKLYNKHSLADLKKYIPQIKPLVKSFLPRNTSIKDDEKVLVPNPLILEVVGKIINDDRLEDLSNYMTYRIMMSAAHDLSHPFVQLYYDFQNALFGTPYSYPEPWQQCVDLTGFYFFHSIASMYTKKYIDKEIKNNLKAKVSGYYDPLILIVQSFGSSLHEIDIHDYDNLAFRKLVTSILINIENALLEQISSASWMDKETRKKASYKADKIYATIAYPVEILNDTLLDVHYKKINVNNDHYKNIREVQSFFSMRDMNGLHEIYKKHSWEDMGNLLIANAFYSPVKNSITIPVGVLQEEIYNSKRPNYLNYGSLGMVIGHELTHGFDNIGSQFDEKGDWDFWWQNDTYQKFKERNHCFVEQYDKYNETSVNKNVNGTRTLCENVADWGGISAAYTAYKKWVTRNGQEKSLPGLPYSPQQLFWIAFASFWCGKQTNEHLLLSLLNDVHSPPEYRVIGTVSNFPEFAQDFRCTKNSPMNPSTKCSVWS